MNSQCETKKTGVLVYDPSECRTLTLLFSGIAILIFSIIGFLISYFCIQLLKLPLFIYKACGAGLLCAYICFFGYTVWQFANHIRHSTIKAVVTESFIEVTNSAFTKKMPLDNIVFSLTVSSANNFCLVIATEEDYLTVDCSSVFWFIKNGKKHMDSFTDINNAVASRSPRHLKYLKTNKIKNKCSIKIPLFVFDLEFYSHRANKVVHKLRKSLLNS